MRRAIRSAAVVAARCSTRSRRRIIARRSAEADHEGHRHDVGALAAAAAGNALGLHP